MNGYNGECVKQYIYDYRRINAHTASDGIGVLADVYALIYLRDRIQQVLMLGGGLHTNA